MEEPCLGRQEPLWVFVQFRCEAKMLLKTTVIIKSIRKTKASETAQQVKVLSV